MKTVVTNEGIANWPIADAARTTVALSRRRNSNALIDELPAVFDGATGEPVQLNDVAIIPTMELEMSTSRVTLAPRIASRGRPSTRALQQWKRGSPLLLASGGALPDATLFGDSDGSGENRDNSNATEESSELGKASSKRFGPARLDPLAIFLGGSPPPVGSAAATFSNIWATKQLSFQPQSSTTLDTVQTPDTSRTRLTAHTNTTTNLNRTTLTTTTQYTSSSLSPVTPPTAGSRQRRLSNTTTLTEASAFPPILVSNASPAMSAQLMRQTHSAELAKLVDAEAASEARRQTALHLEKATWRRAQLRAEHEEERKAASAAYAKLREEQELQLVRHLIEVGLLPRMLQAPRALVRGGSTAGDGTPDILHPPPSSNGRGLGSLRGHTAHRSRPGTGAAGMRGGTAVGMGPTTSSGTGTWDGPDGARPMTSVRGAGYTSAGRPRTGAAGSSSTASTAAFGAPPPLATRSDNGPEAQAREMEARVHSLLDASAAVLSHGETVLALERAKEAGRRERALVRHCEGAGLTDSVNVDLTYAVCFNLATAYAAAGMLKEAASAYALIVRNKAYPNAGRLRVNMGNLHLEAGEYSTALKMYRMALDSLPRTFARLRARVHRNVGICHVRTGNYRAAISAFEAAVSETNTKKQSTSTALPNGDAIAAFNLVVCYVALGDIAAVKKSFQRLLSLPLSLPDGTPVGVTANVDGVNSAGAAGRRPSISALLDGPIVVGANTGSDAASSSSRDGTTSSSALGADGNRMGVANINFRSRSDSISSAAGALNGTNIPPPAAPDALTEELRSRQKAELARIVLAAKLIAPVLAEAGGWEAGYDWVLSQLRECHASAASELELAKAMAYVKVRAFDRAVACLRAFERKDTRLKARAAVNLAFIHYLERDISAAASYAELAVKTDRYNARALVNLGVVLVEQNDLPRAKELFLEAIGVEADCAEAVFNLGIVNKSLGCFGEALQAFEKLHALLPHSPEALYHLASLHDSLGDYTAAAKYYGALVTRVPTDPGALARLGAVYAKADDEAQAFHFTSEAYKLMPTNLEVISWLGVWFVKSELYEKAIEFFERASELQPTELKWRLMVGSCYRRLGQYNRALDVYASIHATYPNNTECLRFLVALCRDLGQSRRAAEYAAALERLEGANTNPPSSRQPVEILTAREKQRSSRDSTTDTSASSVADDIRGSEESTNTMEHVDMLDSEGTQNGPILPAPMRFAAPSDARYHAAAASGGNSRTHTVQPVRDDFEGVNLDALLVE